MSSEPHFDRRKFLATSAISLVGVTAGCTSDEGTGESPENSGDGNDGDPTETPTQAGTTDETSEGTEQPENQGSTTAKVGEVVDGGELSMVAQKVTKTETLGEMQTADEGNTFVVVRFAVKNTSDGYVDFSSFWQTRLKDESDHVYESTFGITKHPFDGGTLAAGEVSRGDVVYEVPKDVGALTLQFDFSTFDMFNFDRVTINLNEEANSISDLNQDLNVDVLSTGESASHGDVKVTVHGVETKSQLGSYAEAEDDFEYVVPDFSITNDTDEPLTVSTLLQMRVKTSSGFSYSADLAGSSQLDQKYAEGSDIAPGDTRRGKLAYQVNADAETRYFVFDFYDFGDTHKAFWELK